jgi:thioester reductase-like protein
LAGECLAKGYINRPDLTEAAFVDDPFFAGQKMYKTGDIARLKTDGVFDFIGRVDSQVKIDGQRIELEEITREIIASGIAAEAATIVIDKTDTLKEIRAFVVPKAGVTWDEATLRQYMRKNLPEYMIPSVFIVLQELPKTASGKADLQKLKAWEGSENEMEALPITGDTAQALPTENTETEIKATEEKETDSIEEGIIEAAEVDAAQKFDQEMQLREAQTEKIPVLETEMVASAATKTDTQEEIERIVMPQMDAGEIEAQMYRLWCEVLGKQEIAKEISFFQQGGTSLAALNLLSQYYNYNWQMTLAEFYEQPTMQLQLARICDSLLPTLPKEMQTAKTQPEEQAIEQVFYSSKEAPPLPAPRVKKMQVSQLLFDAPIERVLLTGATGYLGAHLLYELLETGLAHVICLVRGGSARLEAVLVNYFGAAWWQVHQEKIEVWQGDICQEDLGISDWAKLKGNVQIILHAAADVRHYATGEDSLRTNILGTKHIVSLAKEIGAKLMHISTISVSGEHLQKDAEKKVVFKEEHFEIGQNWQENVYVRGKFIAEQVVFDAAAEGLSAKVFRVGHLVGRKRDGVFQNNPLENSFYRVVQGLQRLSCLPHSLKEYPVEMTPVDDAAKAIISLVDGEDAVYHIFNPHYKMLAALVEELKMEIEYVADDAFLAYVKTEMQEENNADLAMVLDFWQRYKKAPAVIIPSAEKTEQVLAARAFSWEEPKAAALLKAFISLQK